MLGVGKHIHRLDSAYLVLFCQQGEVAGLCGGVAAHVHDAFGLHHQQLLHHVGVHTAARRIGDDDVGLAVRRHKLGGQHLHHVAGK